MEAREDARETMKQLGYVLGKAPRTRVSNVDISSYDSVMKAEITKIKD
jgi:hypothetical protein